MFIVICYDIGKNKIRRKISRRLIEECGQRVQKSVFEIEIKRKEFEKLKGDLKKIKQRKDMIAYYTLCEGCIKKAVYQGPKNNLKRDKGVTFV